MKKARKTRALLGIRGFYLPTIAKMYHCCPSIANIFDLLGFTLIKILALHAKTCTIRVMGSTKQPTAPAAPGFLVCGAMTEDQFKALAELLGLRRGAAQEAARLVLVHGQRPTDAAATTGLSVASVSNAVARARRGLELVKAIGDLP